MSTFQPIILAALTFIVGGLLGYIFGRIPAHAKWRNGYAYRLRKRIGPIVTLLNHELERHIKEEEKLFSERQEIEITPKTLTDAPQNEQSFYSYCHGNNKHGGMCRNDLFRCLKCGKTGCDYWASNNECSNQGFRGGECLSCGAGNKQKFDSKIDMNEQK